MTTVGYGDITPATTLGRLIAVFTMFSGIIIVALPITVIGANFEKQYEKQFFQDEIVSSCTTDQGLVNYAKLSEIFTDLDMRGNLRVKLPKDDEELRTLVRRYDWSNAHRSPITLTLHLHPRPHPHPHPHPQGTTCPTTVSWIQMIGAR